MTDSGKTSPTLTATMAPNVVDWTWNIDGTDYEIKIRKLMPIECWRLMGFKDSDFKAAEAVNANTNLYKQAGNSIVKDVLMYLFAKLINPDCDSDDIDPNDTERNRRVLYGTSTETVPEADKQDTDIMRLLLGEDPGDERL